VFALVIGLAIVFLHPQHSASNDVMVGGVQDVELVQLKPQLPTLESELKVYLEGKHSPLKDYVPEIIAQPNWKKIIAISSIESQFCKRQRGFNCWGIKGKSGYRIYGGYADALVDANRVMQKYSGKSYKQMLGIYVVPGSPSWLNATTKTDAELTAIEQRTRPIH
jgi:hypothetical protein